MIDGNDSSKRLIKSADTLLYHIRSMESNNPAAGEPVSLIYPAVGEPVSLIYPAAGEPVSLLCPAAGEPVSLKYPAAGEPVWRARLPLYPAAGEPDSLIYGQLESQTPSYTPPAGLQV